MHCHIPCSLVSFPYIKKRKKYPYVYHEHRYSQFAAIGIMINLGIVNKCLQDPSCTGTCFKGLICERESNPGHAASPSEDNTDTGKTTMHAHSHLRLGNNSYKMGVLDCGKKLEYLKKTHANFQLNLCLGFETRMFWL
ncbi:hypothetical protein AMECASPLE_039202 [Ameca splendens]|uniref:Uncharacterized protein n=1 Tax=Ameca splendens TaxID=208324 RepID=A0ABV1A6E3_9TELE